MLSGIYRRHVNLYEKKNKKNKKSDVMCDERGKEKNKMGE